jgi:RimJ/RimL family protein N-acetyltransferase
MIQHSIDTGRLSLVPLAEEHIEFEVLLDATPEVMRFLGDGLAREREVVEQHHRGRLSEARDGLGFWAGFVDAVFVGWWLLSPAAADDTRGQAEVGYRLLPDFWRQGLASEGAAALLAYGFEEVGLTQIFAETMTINEGSRAVLNKLGLTYVGTRGAGVAGAIPGSEHGDVDYVITKDEWVRAQGS